MSLLSDLALLLKGCKPVIREGGGALVPQERLRADPGLVRRALMALPNTTDLFPSRESYLDVGYAIKAALPDHPDEAFDLFRDWCAKWDGGSNDADVIESDWGRMKPPYRRGASWLIELAHGHAGFDRAEQWFQPIGGEDPLFPGPAAAVDSGRTFVLVPFNQAADTALTVSARPLVKGLLDQGTMSVVYGDSNAGKTFVLLDLAYHVASGRPWGGLRTFQGPCVYVVAEGSRSARKRIMALHRKYGPTDDFFLIESSVDLFNPEADLRPLIAALQPLRPVFVALDTLARVIAGGDENSTKDMSLLVKNADVLRAAVGCHLAFVHHTGKDASRGARGSSALRAATDTEIELEPGRLTATKQRDMDKSFCAGFALENVELGRDEDGDPISSATVRLSVGEKPDAPALAGIGLEVYAAVEALCVGRAGVTPKDATAFLIEQGSTVATPEGIRFQMRTLEAKGHLQRAGRGLWTLREGATRKAAGWFEPAAFSDGIFG